MKLLIAEKPSAGRDMASAIGKIARKGKGWVEVKTPEGETVTVTWCIGHLLSDLYPGEYDERFDKWWSRDKVGKDWGWDDLPFVPEWKKKPTKRTLDHWKVVKKLISQADVVIHAGDPDQEGQVIVDEILEYAGFKGQVARLLATDLSAKSIQREWKSLKDNREMLRLYHAGIARARSDWVIGMNLSMGITLSRGLFATIGRVQTPTLALVVARDREIENFKPEPYWAMTAKVSHEKGEWQATWKPGEDASGLDDQGRMRDKEEATRICKESKGEGLIVKVEKKKKKEQQPLGWTQTKLQSSIGNRVGGAKKVLAICQSLYETKKVLSYPRTGCSYLPTSLIEDAPEILKAIVKTCPELKPLCKKADLEIRSRIWNDKKVNEASHYALAPTTQSASLTDEEMIVYKTVAKRFIAQFLPPYEYLATTIDVERNSHLWRANGKVTIVLGWRETEQANEQVLPEVKEGDKVNIDPKTEKKMTQPPPRFTEASLVGAMEGIASQIKDPEIRKKLRDSKGIGTDATRAAIVDGLIKKKFLEKKREGKKQVLISTPDGRSLIDNVSEAFPELINPALTAFLEGRLEQVRLGKLSLEDAMKTQMKFVHAALKAFKEKSETLSKVAMAARAKGKAKVAKGVKCPKCGSKMLERKAKKSGNVFYGCEKWPDCDGVVWPEDKKKKKADKKVVDNVFCPQCGKEIVEIKGKDGKFWACSGFPDCKFSTGADAPKCNICKSPMKKSKKGTWWCINCAPPMSGKPS